MYDPVIGRWWSPDPQNQFASPYLAMGNSWPNAIDPDGEFVIEALIAGAWLGMMQGMINNQMDDKSFYNFEGIAKGTVIGGLSGSLFGVPAVVGSAIDTFTFGKATATFELADNLSLSLSPSIALGATGTGAAFGAAANLHYRNGDFGFSVGSNLRNIGSSIGGGISYYDRANRQSFSLGLTNFRGEHAQNNWFVGYTKGDFSFRMTNDAFVGGDKFRTAAAEIGIKEYSFGFNLYTTSPESNSEEYKNGLGVDKNYVSPLWGNNKYYTYSKGERIHAGLYIGYRKGNFITRRGIDGPWVQDATQNFIHKYIVKGPYFNTNKGSSTRPFYQFINYNPWSLY